MNSSRLVGKQQNISNIFYWRSAVECFHFFDKISSNIWCEISVERRKNKKNASLLSAFFFRTSFKWAYFSFVKNESHSELGATLFCDIENCARFFQFFRHCQPNYSTTWRLVRSSHSLTIILILTLEQSTA